MEKSLTLEHGGPVELFEINFDSPGVYELLGSTGVGKTSVLKGIDHLSGKNVDLTVTDGYSSGQVKGFGVVAPIGGRKRRKGELDVEMLDVERFSLSDLVDPPIKNPVAADRHRIKALISLRGVDANPADYYELVGGSAVLEKMLPPDKIQTDDPVLLATRIKAALDGMALSQAGSGEHEMTHARSAMAEFEGVDLTAEHDSATLQQAHDSARRRCDLLEEQARAAVLATDNQILAKESLRKAEESYSGPNVMHANEDVMHAKGSHSTLEARLNTLKQAIEDTERKFRETNHALRGAQAALKAAEQHHNTCQLWTDTLREKIETPDPADVAEAASHAIESSENLENGVRIRDALGSRNRARVHQDKAEAFLTQANRYRECAARIPDVLTTLIDCDSIRAASVDGETRLVVDHKRGKMTLFADLSDGERVRLSIDATVPRLAERSGPSVFAVPQRIWQDLAPSDKSEIDRYAELNNIYIVAAQVTDGALRVARWHQVEQIPA